jgi:hypothetical protein
LLSKDNIAEILCKTNETYVETVGVQLRLKPETLNKAGFEPEYKYNTTPIQV